jgi:hypothetical protein
MRKPKSTYKYNKKDYDFRQIIHKILWICLHPDPVTKLTLSIWRTKMSTAIVQFNWVKSVSTDVVTQSLKVTVLGQDTPVVNVVLEPSVETFGPIELPEKVQVHVQIVVNDGSYDSIPATLDFALGDLITPEPVTGLSYQIVDKVVTPPVIETPTEEVPPVVEIPLTPDTTTVVETPVVPMS